MKKITKILALMVLVLGLTQAQDISNNTFGKGFNVLAKDSSFQLKSYTRIQNQYSGVFFDDEDVITEDYMSRMQIRRASI